MDDTLRHEREQLQEQAQGTTDELRKLRDELESLKPMQTLGETEYRNLDERYGAGAKGGRVFGAGMGAEAVREIISRMDLEELARSLHVEVRKLRPAAQGSDQRRLRSDRGLPAAARARLDDPVGPAGHPAGPAPDGPADGGPFRDLRP
jgi:hypothetical protein